jgi:2Fe-2S ferredoxin
MRAAITHGIPGIDAECGGCKSCATCHVYVDPVFSARTGEPDPDERELLSFSEHTQTTSRLSCQIQMNEDLDGLVVRIPESQR